MFLKIGSEFLSASHSLASSQFVSILVLICALDSLIFHVSIFLRPNGNDELNLIIISILTSLCDVPG